MTRIYALFDQSRKILYVCAGCAIMLLPLGIVSLSDRVIIYAYVLIDNVFQWGSWKNQETPSIPFIGCSIPMDKKSWVPKHVVLGPDGNIIPLVQRARGTRNVHFSFCHLFTPSVGVAIAYAVVMSYEAVTAALTVWGVKRHLDSSTRRVKFSGRPQSLAELVLRDGTWLWNT